MQFTYGHDYQTKRTKTYDQTKLLKYTIDPTPEKTLSIARSRYRECPPLRPERFRRLMKIRWGIDINDYPKDALIWFGPDYKLSFKHQTIIDFYQFREDEPVFSGPPPPEYIYVAFEKYFLYYDNDVYPILLKYINEMTYDDLDAYWYYDVLLTIYKSSLSNPISLINYIDSMTYTRTHKLDIFFEYEDPKGRAEHAVFRTSEAKSNQLYLYIKDQEIKGRIIRNTTNQVNQMIDLGFNIDTSVYRMPLYASASPWHTDTWARSKAAVLSFLLQLEHKSQRKYVIQYMSGQVDSYSYRELEDSIRTQIRSNNYYGHAILREFCENPERDMPTLEKIGTSFDASVINSKTLLYLEPYPDSYDIDTMQPSEIFKAYEMGYDDYYFVDVTKPVESSVAGPDGYAMILDRTETVYGYIRKTEIKEISEAEKVSKQITAQSTRKLGKIDDPDGYVNIRKESNADSEIIGKIVDKELFFYWEVPNSNWWYVQTNEEIQGFVHKSRIREKVDAGSWILDE